MRVVYHLPFSPFSRKVRLILAEKQLEFDLRLEDVWRPREEYLALNPAGQVPVLVDGALVIADSTAIAEYLEEAYPSPTLIGQSPAERAEARRLSFWFDLKFFEEVTRNIVHQKLASHLSRAGGPNSELIRIGRENLRHHLEYIGFLTDRRNWLAGDDLTCADLAAAAQLSVIDYLGDVPWELHQNAKSWYSRLKSRASFQPLLADQIAGLPPAVSYINLNF
tara:strand:- start:455 stop:1120 length:666 start_codon:yes stop_codon:yes gene_type:complete